VINGIFSTYFSNESNIGNKVFRKKLFEFDIDHVLQDWLAKCVAFIINGFAFHDQWQTLLLFIIQCDEARLRL
jgi:hypothetical protein